MIQDIFSVIVGQGQVIIGVLLLIVLSQALISLALKRIFGEQLTSNEYLTLSMAGWLLPASLLSILSFLFGFKPSAPFNLLLLISLTIISIVFLLRLKPQTEADSKSIAFFLLLFFSILILLRLAFISKVVLPSYFDSAAHYLLIKNILGDSATGIFTSLKASYYHLGFHLLTAFVASTFQTEITKTMLILGQMVLALIPLSVFFLVKHETKSNVAGIFAVSLSAFGWYMPAHAVDWGKYPALTSLGLMPFVLSLAYLFSRNKNALSLQKQRALYLLLGTGILVSGFIHSRSLVVIGIVFVAWIIATWQRKLRVSQRTLMLVITMITVILEIIYIQKQDVLGLLFDPYIHKGMLVTGLVLLLSVFAQKNYPQLTLTCLLATCFLLGSLFIPVLGLIPGHDNLTLLDRPFVEMILFLPLALLGGLGLAGLGETLQAKNIKPELAGLIVTTLILINAFYTYNLYPEECCVLAGNDDMAAMDWMNNQLPIDAHIGISATTLKVLASESFEGYVGGDAGIWITPLINRSTFPVLYDSNFGEQATLDSLCQMNINYLYVGELGQNFDDSQLNAQPAWYKLLLSMPRVKIYQIVGCN